MKLREKCPRCGTPANLESNSRFCLECGTDLAYMDHNSEPEPTRNPAVPPVPEPEHAPTPGQGPASRFESEPTQEHTPTPEPQPRPAPGPAQATGSEPTPQPKSAPSGGPGTSPWPKSAPSGGARSNPSPTSPPASNPRRTPAQAPGAESKTAHRKPRGILYGILGIVIITGLTFVNHSKFFDEIFAGSLSNDHSATERTSIADDISNLSRTEKATLFATTVTSRKIADSSGNFVDYTTRNDDLARLVSKDSSLYKDLMGESVEDFDETTILNINYNSPIASQHAFVTATDGDVYAVTADETLTEGDPDKESWRPEELVVIFDKDDMIEHAYRLDDYRHDVLGIENQDYLIKELATPENEALSPKDGQDYVTFETDDFKVELPGSWSLRKEVPSSKDSVFGLENEVYYFLSKDYHSQFFIALETFDLESYGPSTYLSKTMGFTSSEKQLTVWQLYDFPDDVQNYILDKITLY